MATFTRCVGLLRLQCKTVARLLATLHFGFAFRIVNGAEDGQSGERPAQSADPDFKESAPCAAYRLS
jgi:hypothetical protein